MDGRMKEVGTKETDDGLERKSEKWRGKTAQCNGNTLNDNVMQQEIDCCASLQQLFQNSQEVIVMWCCLTFIMFSMVLHKIITLPAK